MITEYIRNLNVNYERLQLDSAPEEKKYQYCILNRGGISGLLGCSLRFLDEKAYLYYDISSKQTISSIFEKKSIHREWILGFFEDLEKMKNELRRFLLDYKNLILTPEHLFQDIETGTIFFMYVPYYEGDRGIESLLSFWVEHIDYDDEGLVEFVYKIYDGYTKYGLDYFENNVQKELSNMPDKEAIKDFRARAIHRETLGEEAGRYREEVPVEISAHKREEVNESLFEGSVNKETNINKEINIESREETQNIKDEVKRNKSIFSILENRRKKARTERDSYEEYIRSKMSEKSVAEDISYESEEIGRTIFIDETKLLQERKPYIYTQSGVELKNLSECSICVIGKKAEDVDIILQDASVSRIHAKISRGEDGFYIEDTNSTNGTFKNGLRLKPYEKRLLDENDEIRVGKVVLLFKLI